MCCCLNKTLFYKNLHFKLPVHTKFVEFCDNFTHVGVELKIRCHFSLKRNQLSNNTQVYIDGAVQGTTVNLKVIFGGLFSCLTYYIFTTELPSRYKQILKYIHAGFWEISCNLPFVIINIHKQCQLIPAWITHGPVFPLLKSSFPEIESKIWCW